MFEWGAELKKEHFGVCHICGEEGKLTYEHIPPEAAFNKIPRKMHTIDYFSEEEQDNQKYTPFQRGVGFHSLCSSCNSFTGSKYGNAFSAFVTAVGTEIMKIPKEERNDVRMIQAEKINLLAVFKQVLSLFCSVNNPEHCVCFREYLLDEDQNVFDASRHRIYMYLHAGTIDRFLAFHGQLNTNTGAFSFCSEISCFPFGFILYDMRTSKKPELYGNDITQFSTCEPHQLYKVNLPLPFLVCNTPALIHFG